MILHIHTVYDFFNYFCSEQIRKGFRLKRFYSSEIDVGEVDPQRCTVSVRDESKLILSTSEEGLCGQGQIPAFSLTISYLYTSITIKR